MPCTNTDTDATLATNPKFPLSVRDLVETYSALLYSGAYLKISDFLVQNLDLAFKPLFVLYSVKHLNSGVCKINL
ncbi:unnamed protein product [Caretta caretta]